MLPFAHLIISAIFSFFGLFFYNDYLFWALFLFAAVFLDFDHYVYYVFKKKDLNPIKAYEYHLYSFKRELDKKNQRIYLRFFHTAEFFVLFLVLGIFFKFFQPIFFGCLFHEFLDLIYEFRQKNNKYKRAFSITYYVWQNEKTRESKHI